MRRSASQASRPGERRRGHWPDTPATTRSRSIHAGLRFDVRDFIGEREGVERPIVDFHRSAPAAPAIEPGDAVLHPVLVVALGEVLVHVRSAALLAVGGAMHGND